MVIRLSQKVWNIALNGINIRTHASEKYVAALLKNTSKQTSSQEKLKAWNDV